MSAITTSERDKRTIQVELCTANREAHLIRDKRPGSVEHPSAADFKHAYINELITQWQQAP